MTVAKKFGFTEENRQPQCEKESMEYIEKHLWHFSKVCLRRYSGMILVWEKSKSKKMAKK